MNLDELRSVQTRERQKDELQHLQDDFYQRVGDYITDLKEQRERAAERADSPFDSPEVKQLTDEINTAEEVAESIYERRMGKLVKAASLSASDYSTDTDGLTAEEQALFDDLVDRITANKEAVLDVLAGASDQESPDTDAQSDSTSESVSESPESMADPAMAMQTDSSPQSVEATTDGGRTTVQSSSEPAPEPTPDQSRAESPSADRITVQVLEDVGDILGVDDQQYDLATDDVVSLPAPNAEPLIEQEVAEPIDAEALSSHE